MKTTLFTSVLITLIWLSGCSSNADNSGVVNAGVTSASGKEAPSVTEPVTSPGKPVHLTKSEFIAKVYDFEKNPNEWVYKGNKPCIIDFYADWCKPCKMVAPILEELAQKYDGQLVIYKINTDEERELAQTFGIRSIPTILFCPVEGQPQMTQGALPKETFEKVISEVLINKK